MAETIVTVGVVGLGTMGAGIAEVCIRSGLDTVAWDIDEDAVSRGRAGIEQRLAAAVEKGRVGAEDRDAALGRLRTTTDLEHLSGCDLVIEAIVEDVEVKSQLFGRLGSIVGLSTVLATNTSALSVTEIASAARSPERVVGMHFFNPVPVLPLVEIVRAELSSDAAVETAVEFASRIGKQPLVCLDTPGFVVNRMLIPVLNEAVHVFDEGIAGAEAIDLGMRAGTNWPIGPLALIDLIGIDTYVHVCDALWEAYHEPRFSAPPRLVRMVRAGLLGRKSGRGFYDYRKKED